MRLVAMLIGATLSSGWDRVSAAAPAPTNRQSLDFVQPLAPHPAPDCRSVAYETTRTNWADDRIDHDVSLKSAGGDAPLLLSIGEGDTNAPGWSADGHRLAFLSDRAIGSKMRGPSEVTVYDRSVGSSQQVTHALQGVDAFSWSPDGTRIAYISAGTAWEVRLTSLAQDPRRLSPAGMSVAEIAYSPDGKRLALVAQPDHAPALSTENALYVAEPKASGWLRLATGPGLMRSPTWSPDGHQIAFLRTEADRYLHSESHVFAVSATGGEPRLLDPRFGLDPDLVAWTTSGVLLVAYDRTDSRLFRLDPLNGRVVVNRLGKLTPYRRAMLTPFSDGHPGCPGSP